MTFFSFSSGNLRGNVAVHRRYRLTNRIRLIHMDRRLRQQSQVTSSFNFPGQKALMFSTGTASPTRRDFSSIGNEVE
jgi:hypothetical protein